MTKTGDKTLIEYVADWINKIPEDHRIHAAFKSILRHTYETCFTDKRNTVFLFQFPMSDAEPEFSAQAAALGIGQDIISSNTPAIMIAPDVGYSPIQAMNAWNPNFSILCRHNLPGCAYKCLYYLMLELNNNANVFPQNGVVFAINSQPHGMWHDRRGLSVYKAAFRVLAAEPIV